MCNYGIRHSFNVDENKKSQSPEYKQNANGNSTKINIKVHYILGG